MTESLRVLFVYGGFPPKPVGEEDGGADYLERLTRGLAKLGIECHVLTSRTVLQPEPWQLCEGVHIWPVIHDWSASGVRGGEWRTAREVIGKVRPGVIHLIYPDPFLTWGKQAYFLPFVLKLLAPRIPLITTFFAFAIKDAGPLTLAGLLGLFAGSRCVNITSDDLQRQFVKVFPFWRHKLSHITVGNNLEVDQQEPVGDLAKQAEAIGLDPQCEYIAFFGFVTADKGMEQIFDALRILADRWPQLRLLVVGGRSSDQWSDYEKELYSSLDTRGIRNQVIFSGFCSDQAALQYVRVAKAVVLPFTKNTLGRSSLAYAAAAGMPIITTWQGEQPEYFRHGEHAYLVPPCDAVALSEAIDAVLTDDHLRTSLGAGASALARRMSWGQIADEWAAVYQRIS